MASKLLKITILIPALIILITIVIINARIYYHPEIRIAGQDTVNTNVLKKLRGLNPALDSNEEINLITQNGIPYSCDVAACGIQIMKPLLLHASSKATSQKHRRVIHLEFNTIDLPKGLEWAEKVDLTIAS